jgi:hypothetical protein
MTFIAEEIVVHEAGVARFVGFVDASCEKEDQKGDFADGKEYQQGVDVSFRPEFGGGGEKDQRSEKKPEMALERTPRNGHICRVNKSKNGYQEYAKQKQSVGDAVIGFEILPLFSPVPLADPQ